MLYDPSYHLMTSTLSILSTSLALMISSAFCAKTKKVVAINNPVIKISSCIILLIINCKLLNCQINLQFNNLHYKTHHLFKLHRLPAAHFNFFAAF